MDLGLDECAVNICRGTHTFVSNVSQHANPIVNALALSILHEMPLIAYTKGAEFASQTVAMGEKMAASIGATPAH